ncbi:MAG: WYL domain-containing protein [Proteobacteria bacterium]|nr:WYL domain-containing protein [Pseudomonadota bacterium]
MSPQRLARYRDNWYLDAWCHHKEALRIFAVECIRSVEQLASAAICAGTVAPRRTQQRLRYLRGQANCHRDPSLYPQRARWVCEEIWHPEQQNCWLADGRYELRLPYSDDRELLMDILKHKAEVEILAPSELREAVAASLRSAAAQYQRENQQGSGFETGT